jgi:hypothetical protein
MFGHLRVGDEVYIVNGNSVEIAKVQKVVASKDNMFVTFGDTEYLLPILSPSLCNFYKVGDIYCDIDGAIKVMEKALEKALYDYKCASGALNKLELKKKKL